MKLSYPTARKATIKGPYIYLDKAGPISLNLGAEGVEVPDEVAHKILEQDGDIIKVYHDPVDMSEVFPSEVEEVPEKKRAAAAPRNKMAGEVKNK
jgi:hypothetical protein